MIDSLVETLFEVLGHDPNLLGLTVLVLGAGLEYVFPPVPGDLIVLLGGVLVAAQGWPWPLVFVTVTLGAVAGSMVTYSAGRWLDRHPGSWLGRQIHGHPKLEKGIDRVLAGFERHGVGYIAINRFLPGIRGFFFLAAGMTGMNRNKVLLWGAVSAAAWNGAVLLAGTLLGGNLDAMQRIFERYTTAAWIVITVAIAFFVGRMIWRRARS